MNWLIDLLIELLELIWSLLLLTWPIIVIVLVKSYLEKRKVIEEKNKKNERERKKKEFDQQRKKIYTEHLSVIYDHRCTSELIKIHDLLQIMHYNDGDDPLLPPPPPMLVAYDNAKNELLRIMKNSSWKVLCMDGKIEKVDSPFFVTIDMNYVYRLLNSRGVTNW